MTFCQLAHSPNVATARVESDPIKEPGASLGINMSRWQVSNSVLSSAAFIGH